MGSLLLDTNVLRQQILDQGLNLDNETVTAILDAYVNLTEVKLKE